MYEIYRANGQDYHVYPTGKEKFLAEFPNAELIGTAGEEEKKEVEEQPKKIEPTAEIAAPAVGQNDMALQQEDGSLELQEISNEEKRKLPYAVSQRLIRNKKPFTLENVEQAKLEVAQMEDKTFEERVDAIKNDIIGNGPQRFKAIASQIGNPLSGNLGPTGLARLQNASVAIATAYDKIFDTDESAKKLKEEYKDLLAIQKAVKPLPSVTDDEAKGLLGVLAGVAGDAAQVGISVVPTIAATFAGGAVGGPVGAAIGGVTSTFSQIAPQFIVDYNLEKAKTNYPNLSEEDAVNKSIEKDEIDTLVPLAGSVIATLPEYFGAKGVTNYLLKNTAGKTLINKLARLSFTSGKEGLTEVVQLFPEAVNTSLAQGKSIVEATEEATEYTIDNAVKTFVSAAVGTAAFGGLGRGGKGILNKAWKTAKNMRVAIDEGQMETIINEISDLNVQRIEANDPAFKEAIDEQIKTKKQQLDALAVRANAIFDLATPDDFKKINDLEDLKKSYINKVKNIQSRSNEIDPVEYQKSLEIYKEKYLENQARIKGVVNEIQQRPESIEGVSEVSIQNATAINDAYQVNPGSTEVFNNVVVPKMQPLINKVANKLFKEYPEFGEKAETKQDFIVDLIYGTDKNPASSLRGLYKSFNPEEGQKLSTYIVRNLENRGKRILDEKIGQQVTEGAASIEAPQVRELTSDERVELATAEDKIDTGKKIGLKFDDNKIKSTVLKHSNPDAKKFKTQIANDFKLAFKEPVDNFLGKDTKTKKQFTETVISNAAPLYDVLTVEGMRMARGVEGTNPFIENGMLVEKDGKLEKAAFDNIKVESLIDYLTNADLPKQARSNRQARFKEAVAVSIASAQAVKLLKTDTELQNRYKDLNELKQDVVNNIVDQKKVVTPEADLSQAIEIAQMRDINSLQKAVGIEGDIVINDSNRSSIQQEVQKLAESGDIAPWMIDRAANFAFHGRAKDLTTGKRIEKPARFSLYYGKSDPAFLQAANAAKENWKGKNFSIKRVGIPKAKLSKEWKNKNKAQEKENMDALVYFSEHLNSLVQADKMPVNMAAMFIYNSYATTTGLIKVAAPFKYASKVFEYGKSMKQAIGKKFREEHNPPSSVVGASIIWGIKNNQLGAVLESVKENYYQTQLSKKADEQLDNAKLDATLPEGKSIFDNPAARFAAAGIDLNTIENIETGQTLAEEQKVVSESTPDAVKAANEVVIEDKIEYVIDRAIAKLTELTGTKGFAIDPFLLLAAKDVSLNVLIGGLRTVKATYKAGKSLTKAIDAGYQNVKKYMSEAEWLEFARVSVQEVEDVKTPGQVRLSIYNESGVAKAQETVRKESEKLLKNLGIETEGLTTDEINQKLDVLRKARNAALDKKAPKKKARVFDFDDTLAQSKSNVLYTLPDGTTGKLNATEFAAQSEQLMEAGAEFDFSEFSKVVDGSKGPLAVLAKKLTEAKGDRDIFVLTARPANAAGPIQSFLRSALGISIPIENITGLGDGAPSAKAFWMAEKVSEGYNDLFFADDAVKNVKAVDKMLTDLGVKKKVQVAKEAEAPSLEDNMDNILRSKKPTAGSIFRKFNIYVPPGADDFAGLLYTFLGKGNIGETQMKFFQDNLMNPFAKGMAAYEAAKVSLARDHSALKKRYKNKKLLKQKILDGLYTNEQAVRAYLYEKAGYDLGMNKADAAGLVATVESNPELKAFADDLSKITKVPEGYPEITQDWLGGNIQTDLANVSNKAQRKLFLTEFINNKDQIFSEPNMKLIKQMHGNDFTDALKNVLERMTTGINRKKGKDKEFNVAMDWINQSVAGVMAINIRSAVLQQLSIVNFMNWTHNNPFAMARAMGNVPQFTSDFINLWNSTFLTERRGGLKIEINTADLADSNPGNFFLRTHKKLLELGFKPTQWGDSFAISFGGASWYRNRINQLVKEGQSEKEAADQAMLEFQEISETTQQSSRPDKISRQQASEIGRFILAFANTPLQYARETKKATLDLINGRGDWKTNASKIVYYGAAQNIIFSGLQSALFSLLLSDDDDDEQEKKKIGFFANGLMDGFLRGMGYAGAVIATLKNLGMEYWDQRKKREAGERVYDPALGLIQAGATISPPISKKIGDIVEAQKFENWRQYKDDPFYQGFAIANYVAAITNIPLDRAFKKAENLMNISFDQNEAWQNILLALGWSPYQLNIEQDSKSKKKKSKQKKKGTTPIFKKESLPEGVLGKAHKDGTIQVAPGLSPAKKKEVIAHEKKHIADMKSGKLGYDASNVYWNGNKYPRTPDKKIIYDGVAYDEGHKHLPWEKSANNIKV